LQTNGFSIDNNVECNTYIYFKEHKGLRALYYFFIYPKDILDTLKELETNCSYADDSPECNQCNIGTYPMMNTKYIAYLVIKFKK
jgi:hypothetical protein